MVLWSQCPCLQTRVDSFVFFQVSRKTKLYETGRCFAEFRSFRGTEKNTKKEFRVVSRNCETAKQCFVRIFVLFLLNFVPTLRVLYRLIF